MAPLWGSYECSTACADESFLSDRGAGGAAGLAELAEGGGQGPWTWGYDEDQRAVWFSDARPGASEQDVREGLAALAQELGRLGLAFERQATAAGA